MSKLTPSQQKIIIIAIQLPLRSLQAKTYARFLVDVVLVVVVLVCGEIESRFFKLVEQLTLAK